MVLAVCILPRAGAQEQEPGFLDRVTAAPDMEREYEMASKPFVPSTGLEMKSAGGFDKSATGLGEFKTTSARETRTFLGVRNPWFGKKTAEAGTARIIEKTPLAEKAFPVELAPADDRGRYVESSKSAAGSDKRVETRRFALGGTAQGALDLISEGMKRELSIDEVREILNKND